MSDRRFQCYAKDKRALIVAQRTCDDEVLDYVSTRDSEDNDNERLRLSLTMWQRMKVYLKGIEISKTEVRSVD